MQTISKRAVSMKMYHNPLLCDLQPISCKQIELIFKIREYRSEHDLSQVQFAQIASVYGSSMKVKFSNQEIGNYESFKVAPSLKKMGVLLNVLGIGIDDLNYSARE